MGRTDHHAANMPGVVDLGEPIGVRTILVLARAAALYSVRESVKKREND